MDLLAREKWAPHALSVLRIGFAYIILFNGWERIRENPPITFDGTNDAIATSLFWVEITLAVLLLVGLFSRLSATVIFMGMAFNYIVNSIAHGQFPPYIIDDRWLLMCLVSGFLAAAGPGPWSVDQMRGNLRI